MSEDLYKWVLSAYGFLVPVNKTISTKQFSELIEKHYSRENPINDTACKILEKTDATIKRDRFSISIEKNKKKDETITAQITSTVFNRYRKNAFKNW